MSHEYEKGGQGGRMKVLKPRAARSIMGYALNFNQGP